MEEEQKKKNLDGWANVMKKLGDLTKDSRSYTQFKHSKKLTEPELCDLFSDEGFAARVINLPIHDMTREGFTIEADITQDEKDGVMEYLKKLKYKNVIKNHLRWDGVYGGSVLFMSIDDGQEHNTELNVNAIKTVKWMKAFDRYRINNLGFSKLFNEFAPNESDNLFDIIPITGGTNQVHKSRTNILTGLDVPDRRRTENDGWGESVITRVYNQLRQLASAYTSSEFILDDFVQTVLTIKNLGAMIASQGNKDIIERLNILDLSRHVSNLLLLDEGETYTKHSSSVTGIEKLLQEFAQALSAVTGIPVTLLMGRSPAGENATGEKDIVQWYDNVKAMQEEKLKPILEQIITMIFLAKDGPTRGILPKSWDIKFNSLWQPDEKTQAETRKLDAETDNIYISNGTITSAEVAVSRFLGDDSPYILDTSEEERGSINENNA